MDIWAFLISLIENDEDDSDSYKQRVQLCWIRGNHGKALLRLLKSTTPLACALFGGIEKDCKTCSL